MDESILPASIVEGHQALGAGLISTTRADVVVQAPAVQALTALERAL